MAAGLGTQPEAGAAPETGLTMLDQMICWRIEEWGLTDQPEIIQAAVRKVLGELDGEALMYLKDRRLEVRVVRRYGLGPVWAYFPMHRGRIEYRELDPRPLPTTRVLLVISSDDVLEKPPAEFEKHLRHHLGHVMLYLFKPKARNECTDADREWRAAKRPTAATGAHQKGE